MENQTPNPADIPAPGSYHWTPALQRSFLEHLADSGSVKIAAMHVKMTSSAAYQLRQRAEGAAFRIGWGAAILIARQRLADELLDRAIWGYQESSTIMREDDRSFVRRQRVDSRLGLAMLARLDRMVETRARAGEEMLAQIVAGDWAGFLTLFDAAEAARTAAKDATGEAASEAASEETPESGMGAALALWLAGRDNRTNPIAALWRGSAIANEVAQFSGTFDTGFDGEPEAEPTPEEEAEAMTVWHHHETGELRTNFPPPAGFIGIEEGRFGDEDYERTLEPEEEEAFEAAIAEACAPLRKAGEAARRAFFGLPTPANDREAAAEKGSREDAKTRRG
ncbi:hypothetical protein [Sphingopyxis sp. PET50]|uniref:hypothetical protein n=1 Tax=Sphingopyxis sp. PET50 TaxID=2976533 RepID=UPI0021AF0900|nr:hypothetical protein [Sphingopyxis sp. PET50]